MINKLASCFTITNNRNGRTLFKASTLAIIKEHLTESEAANVTIYDSRKQQFFNAAIIFKKRG